MPKLSDEAKSRKFAFIIDLEASLALAVTPDEKCEALSQALLRHKILIAIPSPASKVDG